MRAELFGKSRFNIRMEDINPTLAAARLRSQRAAASATSIFYNITWVELSPGCGTKGRHTDMISLEN